MKIIKVALVTLLCATSPVGFSQHKKPIYLLFSYSKEHPKAHYFYGFKGRKGEMLTFVLEK